MAMSAFGVEDSRISKAWGDHRDDTANAALGTFAGGTAFGLGAIHDSHRSYYLKQKGRNDFRAAQKVSGPEQAALAQRSYRRTGKAGKLARRSLRNARTGVGLMAGSAGLGLAAATMRPHKNRVAKGLLDHRKGAGLGATLGLGGGIAANRMAAGAMDRSKVATGLGHSIINQAPGAKAPTGDALLQGAKHFDEAGALAGKASKLTRISRGGLIGAGVLGTGALLSRNKQPQQQY
jgi:hypothetical protein